MCISFQFYRPLEHVIVIVFKSLFSAGTLCPIAFMESMLSCYLHYFSNWIYRFVLLP